MLRTRKNVWKLPEGDQTLIWYAKGVKAMQSRPFSDPTSWRYQAAVHGYDENDDPFAQPTDRPPNKVEQDTYWQRCQHATWFFLPWHRMYLHYFEQILLDIITGLGGPDDWALPYWNYSDRSNPNYQTLPLAFRSEQLDGIEGTNPLYVRQRRPGFNDGDTLTLGKEAESAGFTIEKIISLKKCLDKDIFINKNKVDVKFGGGTTDFNHQGGSGTGECENVPHNLVHGAIGGNLGWMNDPDTAALDPIFWLHHANIDRLWEVWLCRDPHHQNPTDSAWLDFQFKFHDAHGTPVALKVSQVANLSASLIDYTYEDLSDPIPASPAFLKTSLGRVRAAVAVETTPIDRIDTEEPVLEMVGASDERGGIILGQEQKSIGFALQTPPGPELFSTLSAAISRSADVPEISSSRRTIDREVYLSLENITATKKPIDTYIVYVNLPEGAKANNYPELWAGIIPSFGIIQASKPSREHPGNGVNYSFEITDIVSFLEPQGLWNPDDFHVSFIPCSTEAERMAVPNIQPVKVGRVSLYYR